MFDEYEALARASGLFFPSAITGKRDAYPTFFHRRLIRLYDFS